MHTSYLPSFSWYQEWIKRDSELILSTDEKYQRQTSRNRTFINTSNGILRLSVPVIRPNGQNSLTEEIIVDDTKKWRTEHLRAIQNAYANSPYFDFYYFELERILLSDEKSLVEINKKFIEFTKEHLKLEALKSTSKQLDNSILECPYQPVFFFDKKDWKSVSIIDGLFNLGPIIRDFF